MARINLLPWREEMRQEKKKEFMTQLVGMCLLVVFLCFVWVKSVDLNIADQNERNSILRNEIELLKQQVEEIKELKKRKKELEATIRVIQDLEGTRSIIVHYFDEFAQRMPDGAYYISIVRSGDKFMLEGISESNQRISELLRQLDGSKYFSNPNLISVEAEPTLGAQASRFRLELDAVLPKPKSAEASNG